MNFSPGLLKDCLRGLTWQALPGAIGHVADAELVINAHLDGDKEGVGA